MSRNKSVDYSRYIHEFTDAQGQIRYAVGEWIEDANQYQRPLSANDRKITGCHTEFTKRIETFGGYLSRAQALRRARYLFENFIESE